MEIRESVLRAEDMDQEELAEYIVEMAHRMMVHHTLWFREVEHQLGFQEALKAMDYAWSRTKKIAGKRLAEVLGYAQEGGIPTALKEMPKEQQLQLVDAIAKNWIAQDGVWFQAVEFAYDMNEAKRSNDSTWARFSPFEAWSIKNLLGMEEHPGLEGLARALNFRMYGRLNEQSCHWEDGALIFEMNNCRVQAARKKNGLDDYPCKSVGLVEYSRFAAGIDDRIKMTCIGCPPDGHPENWFCCWKFYIPEETK